MLNFSFRSHRGCKREKNEDRFFVPPENGPSLFAVADGMGGHTAGEVASSISITTVQEKFANSFQNMTQFETPLIKELLEKTVLQANENIIMAQERDSLLQGMGTTLTVLFLLERELLVAHVGDSQAHIFSQNSHIQVTEDHSLAMELLRNGEISPEELHKHPQRNYLTRALGTTSELSVDTFSVVLQDGDYILLCTDGLTSMLRPSAIQQIINRSISLEEISDELIQTANSIGGDDNITFILIKYTGNSDS